MWRVKFFDQLLDARGLGVDLRFLRKAMSGMLGVVMTWPKSTVCAAIPHSLKKLPEVKAREIWIFCFEHLRSTHHLFLQDLQERAQNWDGVAVEDERLVDLSRLLWPFLAFEQSDDQREVFAPCAETPPSTVGWLVRQEPHVLLQQRQFALFGTILPTTGHVSDKYIKSCGPQVGATGLVLF